VDMTLRAREEAEQAAAAYAVHAALQAQAPVDLQAEEHFPGLLSPGTSASVRRTNWGRGQGMQRMSHSTGDFPSLSGHTAAQQPQLSRGQRKKLKAKGKRGDEPGFGDVSGLPPAHIMSLGQAPEAAAAASATPSTGNVSDGSDSAGPQRPGTNGHGSRSVGSLAHDNEDWAQAPVVGRAGRSRMSAAGGIVATASAFAALSTDDGGAWTPCQQEHRDRSSRRNASRVAPEAANFPSLAADAPSCENPVPSSTVPTLAAAHGALQHVNSTAHGRCPGSDVPRADDFPALGRGSADAMHGGGAGGWSTVPTRMGAQPVALKPKAAKPCLASKSDFPTLGGACGAGPSTSGASAVPQHRPAQISTGLKGANEAVISAIKVWMQPNLWLT
jgi:hypothetical protein